MLPCHDNEKKKGIENDPQGSKQTSTAALTEEEQPRLVTISFPPIATVCKGKTARRVTRACMHMCVYVCVPTLVNVRWSEGKTEQKDGSARHAHHTAVAAKKKN